MAEKHDPTNTPHLSEADLQEIAKTKERRAFLRRQYKSKTRQKQLQLHKQFGKIFTEVLNEFPEADRQSLIDYWHAKSTEQSRQFPQLQLYSDADEVSSNGRVIQGSAATNVEGTAFAIISELLLAPTEVIREVCAHELTHALFTARREVPHVPSISDEVRDAYTEDTWNEEEAVRFNLRKLGYSNRLLIAWELAVEEGKEHWHTYYKRNRSKLGV